MTSGVSIFLLFYKRVVSVFLVVGLSLFGLYQKIGGLLAFVGFRASRLKLAFESGTFHSDQPEIQDSVKSTGCYPYYMFKVCFH